MPPSSWLSFLPLFVRTRAVSDSQPTQAPEFQVKSAADHRAPESKEPRPTDVSPQFLQRVAAQNVQPLTALSSAVVSTTHPTSARSLASLNLPLESVVASVELCTQVRSGESGDWVTFAGGKIRASYEPEFNLIRTYVGESYDVVNIKLSDDRQAVSSIAGHPQLSSDKLSDLAKSGLLHPELLHALGISQAEIREASERTAHEQQLALRLHSHSVHTLASIESYRGTDSTTKVLGQGEAHFLPCESSSIDGLYTTGAGPCLILIAVTRGLSGNAEGVAMAHADAYVDEQALNTFFGSLPPGKVEVSLLAGNKQIATRALKAADTAGATVVFAHAGHAPGDGYGAAVDRKGEIFIGERLSLSVQINTAPSLGRMIRGALNGDRLPVHEQLPIKRH